MDGFMNNKKLEKRPFIIHSPTKGHSQGKKHIHSILILLNKQSPFHFHLLSFKNGLAVH